MLGGPLAPIFQRQLVQPLIAWLDVQRGRTAWQAGRGRLRPPGGSRSHLCCTGAGRRLLRSIASLRRRTRSIVRKLGGNEEGGQ